MHENRETPAVTSSPMGRVRVEKAAEADVHHARVGEVGRGRSTDEAPKAAAEVTEGRPETNGILSDGQQRGSEPDHCDDPERQMRAIRAMTRGGSRMREICT